MLLLKIQSATSKIYRIPLAEPLVDAKHGAHTHFELITFTVELNNGLQGTGYTYTGGRGGAAIKAMLDSDVIPFILGRDPLNLEQINDDLQWHLHYVGRGGISSFAISATFAL